MSLLGRWLSQLSEALDPRGVPARKRTLERAIITIIPPRQVRLPRRGLDALVAVGHEVAAGTLIATSPGRVRFHRRVHASLSGVVTEVTPEQIVIEGIVPEQPPVAHCEPEYIRPSAITDTAREAGLIGMGGAMFPTYVKLSRAKPIDIVMINGCESEPYLTCDHRVLVEHRDEVECGMFLAMHAVGAQRGLVIDRETYYPGGYERLLIQDALGRKVPPRGLPRDVGVLMMNVQSARALHQAVCNGRPLIDRVVTVDGDAVGAPGNYRVPLGTPISHLIDVCQIDLARAAVLLTGGPMMGQPTTPEHVITGGTGGLLALSDEERDNARTEPCLRCGVCMEVCPFNLPAIYLVENPQKAVLGCVECGACQFFCPAHQPLVAGLKQAKATVTAWD